MKLTHMFLEKEKGKLRNSYFAWPYWFAWEEERISLDKKEKYLKSKQSSWGPFRGPSKSDEAA